MKIVRMNTSSFWKGEAGVKGLVEDQGETFEIKMCIRDRDRGVAARVSPAGRFVRKSCMKSICFLQV